MTPSVYRGLLAMTGMHEREAAALHNTRYDIVAEWTDGLSAAPPAAVSTLRRLIEKQREAALHILLTIDRGGDAIVEVSENDEVAQARGWPCATAHQMVAAVVASVYDGNPNTIKIKMVGVPEIVTAVDISD